MKWWSKDDFHYPFYLTKMGYLNVNIVSPLGALSELSALWSSDFPSDPARAI